MSPSGPAIPYTKHVDLDPAPMGSTAAAHLDYTDTDPLVTSDLTPTNIGKRNIQIALPGHKPASLSLFSPIGKSEGSGLGGGSDPGGHQSAFGSASTRGVPNKRG